MKQVLVLMLFAVLVGCTAAAPIKKSGNESSVLLTRACDRGTSMDMAEQHCQQYGRHARPNQVYGCIMSFDCVE